jgi:hypothetical protein
VIRAYTLPVEFRRFGGNVGQNINNIEKIIPETEIWRSKDKEVVRKSVKKPLNNLRKAIPEVCLGDSNMSDGGYLGDILPV